MKIEIENTRVFVNGREVKGWKKYAVLLGSLFFVILTFTVCWFVITFLSFFLIPVAFIGFLVMGAAAFWNFVRKGKY